MWFGLLLRCLLGALACSLVYDVVRVWLFLERRRNKNKNTQGSLGTPYLSAELAPIISVTDEEYEAALQRSGAQLRDQRRGIAQEDAPEIVMRVQRECITMLGGTSALLMQLAHPFVAYGVASHSYIMSADGIRRRFYQTFKYLFGVMFGDWAAAERSLLQVRKMHRRIRGTIPIDLPGGAYHAGDQFNALSEPAAYWVFATLQWNAMFTYELFVGSVSLQQKEQYYQWGRHTTEVWGLQPNKAPANWNEFEHYVQAMCSSHVLAASPPAQKMADILLCPIALERFVPGLNSGRLLALLQAPPAVLELFGLKPTTWSFCWGVLSVAFVSTVYRCIPQRLRHYTQYRLRLHRVGDGRGLDWLERAGLWLGENISDLTLSRLRAD